MPAGGGFGTALAAVGDRLLVGAPERDANGTVHGYLFDPASGALLHDLVVPVAVDGWSQFSVGAVGTRAFVGISPGEDAADGSVTMFDAATGATGPTLCCFGGIAAAAGEVLAIGAPGGGGIFDPASGDLLRTLVMTDPNRRGALALLGIGRRTLALAQAQPVGVHLFDVPTGRRVGFVGTRHGDTRRFGSAMAANGATLAVAEVPQVNVFDVNYGFYLGTIDPPDGLGGATFGTALAWVDGWLAVGAPAGGDTGTVHIFNAVGIPATSLQADDLADSASGFGRALAVLGRSLAVGAPSADGGGAVVIYAPCGDGVVDAPVEQCDDGTTGSSGSAPCDAECRLVAPNAERCGDADDNGETTLSDGVQLLRAAADLASVCTLARCDVDGNGAVTVSDAVQVLRAAAGLPLVGDCTPHPA